MKRRKSKLILSMTLALSMVISNLSGGCFVRAAGNDGVAVGAGEAIVISDITTDGEGTGLAAGETGGTVSEGGSGTEAGEGGTVSGESGGTIGGEGGSTEEAENTVGQVRLSSPVAQDPVLSLTGDGAQSVEGISYVKSTNRIVMDGVNLPKYKLELVDPVGTLTIEVKGENHLAGISATNTQNGYLVSLEGSGSLTINESVDLDENVEGIQYVSGDGINLSGSGMNGAASDIRLQVQPEVRLTVYPAYSVSSGDYDAGENSVTIRNTSYEQGDALSFMGVRRSGALEDQTTEEELGNKLLYTDGKMCYVRLDDASEEDDSVEFANLYVGTNGRIYLNGSMTVTSGDAEAYFQKASSIPEYGWENVNSMYINNNNDGTISLTIYEKAKNHRYAVKGILKLTSSEAAYQEDGYYNEQLGYRIYEAHNYSSDNLRYFVVASDWGLSALTRGDDGKWSVDLSEYGQIGKKGDDFEQNYSRVITGGAYVTG